MQVECVGGAELTIDGCIYYNVSCDTECSWCSPYATCRYVNNSLNVDYCDYFGYDCVELEYRYDDYGKVFLVNETVVKDYTICPTTHKCVRIGLDTWDTTACDDMRYMNNETGDCSIIRKCIDDPCYNGGVCDPYGACLYQNLTCPDNVVIPDQSLSCTLFNYSHNQYMFTCKELPCPDNYNYGCSGTVCESGGSCMNGGCYYTNATMPYPWNAFHCGVLAGVTYTNGTLGYDCGTVSECFPGGSKLADQGYTNGYFTCDYEGGLSRSLCSDHGYATMNIPYAGNTLKHSNEYWCSCDPMYFGNICETNACQYNGVGIADGQCAYGNLTCNSSSCSDRGECILINGTFNVYTCNCSSGYTGTLCEYGVCSQTCGNNGTCVNPEQCFYDDTSFIFNGVSCSYVQFTLNNVSCGNCLEHYTKNSSGLCVFTGCDLHPCFNNGSCVERNFAPVCVYTNTSYNGSTLIQYTMNNVTNYTPITQQCYFGGINVSNSPQLCVCGNHSYNGLYISGMCDCNYNCKGKCCCRSPYQGQQCLALTPAACPIVATDSLVPV